MMIEKYIIDTFKDLYEMKIEKLRENYAIDK